MKKLIVILSYGLLLIVIEWLICIILLFLEGKYWEGNTKIGLEYYIQGASEINALRLIFYLPLWTVFIYFFHTKMLSTLKTAMLNCGLYISISFLMIVFFPFAAEFFSRSFFFFLIFATFVSPMLLLKIPKLTNWLNII